MKILQSIILNYLLGTDSQGFIIIIKDYLGAAYLPEWDYNGIGTLHPGQGYQLKTNGDCILQY